MNKMDEATEMVKRTLGFDDLKLHIFPGTNPASTAEEIAAEIMESIREICDSNAE
jgi:hypothetical protein